MSPMKSVNAEGSLGITIVNLDPLLTAIKWYWRTRTKRGGGEVSPERGVIKGLALELYR